MKFNGYDGIGVCLFIISRGDFINYGLLYMNYMFDQYVIFVLYKNINIKKLISLG